MSLISISNWFSSLTNTKNAIMPVSGFRKNPIRPQRWSQIAKPCPKSTPPFFHQQTHLTEPHLFQNNRSKYVTKIWPVLLTGMEVNYSLAGERILFLKKLWFVTNLNFLILIWETFDKWCWIVNFTTVFDIH